MRTSFYERYRFPIQWISISISIKSVLFIFFAINFVNHYPATWIINNIFIISGDTWGYYDPIESFVDGSGYLSVCRMPGLLPLYGPLYFLFGSVWGKTFIILIQFFTSAVSVYVLSRIASWIFNETKLFYITFILYSLSSFVSIWDHFGYSDSFGTSFLIFSVYFFIRFTRENKSVLIILSGFFLAWSIFFRPFHGIIAPCLMLILMADQRPTLKRLMILGFSFISPAIIFISIWTGYNVSKHNKFIMFQGSLSECYTTMSKDHLAVRDLIISLGGDFQEWSEGMHAQWFFSADTGTTKKNPFVERDFTSRYNLDSIITLKKQYHYLHGDNILTREQKQILTERLVNKADEYRKSYQSEHPLRFYLINRLILVRRFIFPARLDNLPFPKFSEMSFHHKVIKFGYLVLLNLVSLTGLLGILYSFRRTYYWLIPVSIIFLLACVMGYIEQRYLVPAYPFLCVFSAYFVFILWRRKTTVKMSERSTF